MTTFTLTWRTDDKEPLELEFDHSKVDFTEVMEKVRQKMFPNVKVKQWWEDL